MSSSDLQQDGQLMASLAVAMVDQPRASLQELAKAVGISKATLYRFCRTREQLYERLVEHAVQAVSEATENADLTGAAPLEALRRLTEGSLGHRELSLFLTYYWRNNAAGSGIRTNWDQALDAFFLRGQQQGVFRVDIPAAALTEIYVSVLTGIISAEKNGRVARLGMATLVESVFLGGALAR